MLLLGISLLVAGAAVFIAGSVDAKNYEEERTPFNRDGEREMAHDAAMMGGVVAAGLGFLVTILGVVLLVAQRDGQQQQQVVLADGGSDSRVVSQQQRRPVIVGGSVAAVAGLILIALFTAGLAGEGPAATIVGNDAPFRQVGFDSGQGTIQAGKAGGVVIGNPYQERFAAHPDADLMVVEAHWDDAEHGVLYLRVAIDGDEAYRGSTTPGEEFQFAVRGDSQVQITLEPMPDQVVQGLDVSVDLLYFR